MKFQFIHAADLHLDTPFSGIHRVDARLADMLRDATTQAFQNLVAAALEHSVAFVVIAGDVYDGAERGVRAQLAFKGGLDRLARAGIQTLIVHGNHDPVEVGGWSAVRRWPDGVTVFGTQDVEAVPVVREGQTVALVHGISYSRRDVTENLSLRFRRSPVDCFQVGVLHCNAGANADHAPYSPCSIEDLEASGLDYWALGHIHLRQFLKQGAPWIAYPGNLQGLSPKPSEMGAKGALLVCVEDTRVVSAELLPLDVVRFEELQLDVAEIGDVAGLVEAIVEAARERAATQDGRAVVLRISLTGRGPVHRDLRRGSVHDDVLLQSRAALSESSQMAWLDSVQDGTRPDIDLQALRGRGDFAADLLEAADEVRADSSTRAELVMSHLDELPRGELRRLLGDTVDAPPTDEEIESALEAALDRVTEAE
jgi:DNA repair exonuclease SbcCD nuclease subunit